MKPSELESYLSVKGFDTKNYQKYPKFQWCWNAHSFQTIKEIDLKFLYHHLKAWIKIFPKFHGPIHDIFLEIGRQIAL